MIKMMDFILNMIVWMCALVFSLVGIYIIYDGLKVTRSAYLSDEILEYAKADEMVDIRGLKTINEDIIGWIRIDGTDIDYPVLQSVNNEYYLSRNCWREFATAGSIFLDYRND